MSTHHRSGNEGGQVQHSHPVQGRSALAWPGWLGWRGRRDRRGGGGGGGQLGADDGVVFGPAGSGALDGAVAPLEAHRPAADAHPAQLGMVHFGGQLVGRAQRGGQELLPGLHRLGGDVGLTQQPQPFLAGFGFEGGLQQRGDEGNGVEVHEPPRRRRQAVMVAQLGPFDQRQQPFVEAHGATGHEQPAIIGAAEQPVDGHPTLGAHGGGPWALLHQVPVAELLQLEGGRPCHLGHLVGGGGAGAGPQEQPRSRRSGGQGGGGIGHQRQHQMHGGLGVGLLVPGHPAGGGQQRGGGEVRHHGTPFAPRWHRHDDCGGSQAAKRPGGARAVGDHHIGAGQ